jgi:hypothetical protein
MPRAPGGPNNRPGDRSCHRGMPGAPSGGKPALMSGGSADRVGVGGFRKDLLRGNVVDLAAWPSPSS